MLAIASCAALPNLPANAAGFGIEFGADPEQLGCVPVAANGAYRCDKVPKPHSAFELYLARASEEHGICWVKGVGKDIADNRYGTSTKHKVEDLKASLERNYGPPSEARDFVMANALWDDSDEWLMAIAKKERIFMYHWDDVSFKNPKLGEMYLAAGATGSSEGYVMLEYYSTDHEACELANSQAEDDAL